MKYDIGWKIMKIRQMFANNYVLSEAALELDVARKEIALCGEKLVGGYYSNNDNNILTTF
uniref:Transcriptional regulator n=1 Tax=Heterorhabditis bacteriophora TaxID=37862 RepID=A0A1I7WNA4_HETBA